MFTQLRGYKRFFFLIVLSLLWLACRALTTQSTASSPPPQISQVPEETLPPMTSQTPVETLTLPTPRTETTTKGHIYYVRPDGGSTEQCNGLVNAPYSGSGQGQPCAWDHPFRALPPGGVPRLAGGDTLIIADGEYAMGYGAPGTEGLCEAEGAYACFMPPIPSGPDAAHPTRILGETWDSGCTSPPQLWGTQHADLILNLTDSSNIEIACLEITDHSNCVEFHSGGLACERDNYPYGEWASRGLYAEDSANVHLWNLNIHGLASTGIHAGRLTDWTMENVRIAANGWVGWDGDLWEGEDANSGIIRFQRLILEWNGCAEGYPDEQPIGCWAQEVGGYGDGLGTGLTGGHWIVEDSLIRYNTSDGIDLLYARQPDAFIEIRRTLAEGNAGNQIKTTGSAIIENSIIVGNCGFFDGQPFTYTLEGTPSVDNCRALGSALLLAVMQGDQVQVVNNTLTSEGDCLINAECDENGNCDGSESVLIRNNIFVGQTDFLQPDELACLVYEENIPGEPFDVDYSVIDNVKDDMCPGAHDICDAAPGLVNPSIDAFDAHLLADSPAVDAGTSESVPADDFEGLPRDVNPDIGAYEYRPSTSRNYLPLVLCE
jgi:hypothetical protein